MSFSGGIYLKRLLIIIITMVIAISFFGCQAPFEAQRTVTDFFEALNSLDFEKAGALTNAPEFYDHLREAFNEDNGALIEEISDRCFIEFIYTNLKAKVLNCTQGEGEATVRCRITSRSTQIVSEKYNKALQIFTESEAYKAGNDAQKYISLCEYIPEIFEDMKKETQTVTVKVEIKVALNDEGKWIIIIEEALFDAISGEQSP